MKPDPRLAPRRVLRCHAKIMLKGGLQFDARSFDLAPGGVCLIVPEPMTAGQTCVVTLPVPINGQMQTITAVAKVIYSASSDVDGLKTGFQFIEIDPAGAKTVAELCG